MRTREQLIHLRIIHVIIMLATALFIGQFSQWDDATWIPISVLAITGPFIPGMVINKAKQRLIGTLAGLTLSVVIWLIIHFNYNLLVPIAIILIYFLAFSVLQKYTYFIMIVSILLCLNFDYMNLFFTNEIIYLANRSICVLTGIAICLVYESWIFKAYYTNATSLIEQDKLDNLLTKTQEQFNNFRHKHDVTLDNINQCLQALIVSLQELEELKQSCQYSYSKQDKTLQLITHYQEKLRLLYNDISTNAFELLVNKD